MREGQTVAHYRVLGQIGAGAMGVVCKAEDLRLNRMVALKYLAPEATSDPSLKLRLMQEARAASQLDHPNVCRIHEIEEMDDGQIVLVLSYYDGETLAARLARGPLDLALARHFASQLLAGLGHAHDKGVIHRDIKPANLILLPSGELKIVDFGLARGKDNAALTQTGAFVGTVSYMSPEQILCGEVDHRSDLWACGVVLYEMLTGHLPFQGPSPYAVFEAILEARPREPQLLRPELPREITPLLSRALARHADHRFQSARHFLDDLAGLSTQVSLSATPAPSAAPASPRTGNSVVVLPFSGIDCTPESEYFCDGLTDEIITDISGIRAIRTICSSSAMRLKGSADSPRKIAEDLGVRYVLRGTVRIGSRPSSPGNSIRVTVQLIDPIDDSILWAEKYSGTLEDVFGIQENISRQVASALRLKLTPAEERQLVARPLPDVRAFQYYLRARHEILNYSREALDRALAYLEEGEKLVGSNVVLLAAKGQVYWQFINAGIDSDPVYMQKARDCAARALEIDPESAHALRLLGLISIQEGETQRAVHLLKRSIAIDPNDSDSLSWYCALCALSGKAGSAMDLGRRILEIDPLTPIYRFIPGLLSLMAGRFNEALPDFEEAIRLDPANTMLLWCRGQVLALAGRSAEAAAQFRAMRLLAPGQFFTRLGEFLSAALTSDHSAALSAANPELTDIAQGDPHYSWAMAQGFACLGEIDQTLWWLQNATARGFLNFPMASEWDPLLRGLRSEPRFTRLLADMKLRWQAFEV